MRLDRLLAVLLLGALVGCNPGRDERLLGTLEWDRIGLPAEASEVILDWDVAEGQRVAAGQLLLRLDPRRLDAEVAEAAGQVAEAEGRLRELSNGARAENIDAARATLAQGRADLTDAERNFTRIDALYGRKLVAIAELDKARASRDQARATVANADARLRELTNGTRPEQLDQASAALDAARGNLTRLQVSREHLDVRAPRAGVVDALPFRPGDQPPQGAELVSLLVGAQPYARVFVPADQRAALGIGDRLRVKVEGVDTPFDAHVRSIRSESSFTPYFALVGDDASRLVYRAELLLDGDAAQRLPAGLPLSAERVADEH
ncbi:HlyD family efflux transporter periplasmic adaptor subunit [Pseudomonas sp. UL073]|uniref:HlyD family efflux transporter periplasmic adaptor subunit n=1 Tax=Zestomonas insulae TaxID=2809017 RepID=A0ABS2IJD9_9GAMM|nr:HlyD family secretion protein [Pseudomonas insulae]MBM7062288.1 HlyD family efflux transporter periplasmic adaptor subunit [Pseudomonas insulae]